MFEREGLDLWLKPYSILSTAKTTGLIEVIIHQISLTKYWYSNSVLYLLEYSVLFAKTARR